MKTPRACVLIVSLAVVALALVYLRWEQTRIAAGILRGESRWVELRREWWSVQASTAMFRTPARMRHRSDVLREGPRLLVDSYAPISDRTDDHSRYE